MTSLEPSAREKGLRESALSTLDSWRPDTAEQEALRHAFLGFVHAREDACQRSCVAGHVTASAAVLDASGEHTLLTLHPKVGRWLQLGGHCEGDESLRAAALREAREESGIDDLTISIEPIHLDVHAVTCSLGIPTRHFDVRYAVRAPRGAEPVRSAESEDLRWWPIHSLPAGTEDLTGLLSRALA